MSRKLLVEEFEERTVPTVTAAVVFGQLLVGGAPAGAVVITQTSAGAFTVTDGSATVGSFSGVFGVSILGTHRPTTTAENVTVNLGGMSTGFLFAALQSATDSLTVENGTVTTNLVYFGGKGNDTLTLEAGTTVGGSVITNLGAGSNSVAVGGTVTGDLAVLSRNPADTVMISVTGSVGGQTTEQLGTHRFYFPPGQWAPGWAAAEGFPGFAFLGGGFGHRRR